MSVTKKRDLDHHRPPSIEIATENGKWFARPATCTREKITNLTLFNEDASFVSLCSFAEIDSAALITAIEAEPTNDAAQTMANSPFCLSNTFQTVANGKVDIWRTKRPALDLTIAETFVSLSQTRDGGKIYFHLIDTQDFERFPAWLSDNWQIRAINAALAIADILLTAPRQKKA